MFPARSTHWLRPALGIVLLVCCASCSDSSTAPDSSVDTRADLATVDGGSDALPDGRSDTGADVLADVVVTPDASAYTWELVAPPPGAPQLSDVHGSSATDVWIVSYTAGRYHFDGTSWTSKTTDPASGVWAFSPNDAWAISGFARSHFDGAWAPGSMASTSLLQMWGSASKELWVTAMTFPPKPLIDHYAGGTWTQTTLPGAGFTEAVHGSSGSDIWIAGQDGAEGPATWHFDGTSWSSVSTPATAKTLHGVLAQAGGTAWAVGRQTILRFENNAWSDATPQDIGNGWLVDIWASGPADVWAVGYTDRHPTDGTFGAGMIYHYDGQTWTRVADPLLTAQTPALFRIWGAGPGHIWAVGQKGLILYRH